MGWPWDGFVTDSYLPTPFPPRACIRGVASTRFPGLVLRYSLGLQWPAKKGNMAKCLAVS